MKAAQCESNVFYHRGIWASVHPLGMFRFRTFQEASARSVHTVSTTPGDSLLNAGSTKSGTVEPLGSGACLNPLYPTRVHMLFNDPKNNVEDDTVTYDDQTYCCIRRTPCVASDL